MYEVGIGGFFMHARGGLQTEYMGEECFKNVTASVEEGKRLGMRPWAYDENGWPSGFGDGLVNGLGIEYQQKYLRIEPELKHTETAICQCGDSFLYYDVNPFYVDTLDKKVIAKFIEVAYKPYFALKRRGAYKRLALSGVTTHLYFKFSALFPKVLAVPKILVATRGSTCYNLFACRYIMTSV